MLKVWFDEEIVAEDVETIWEAYEIGYQYVSEYRMAFILNGEGRTIDFVSIKDKENGYHGKEKVEDYVPYVEDPYGWMFDDER